MSYTREQAKADQHWPRITVVTVSLNQGRYLENAINSVLSQDYPNLEYIVIDGGSSDNSVEIIKRYEAHLSYWESRADRGQSHALNKGFSRATGDLLAWLNSDDWYASGALRAIARCYEKLDRNVTGAIVGEGDVVDDQGRMLFRPELAPIDKSRLLRWKKQTGFMQPSCFFTREAWETCGPLDEALKYTMDLDLWLKIARVFEFEVLDQVLSHSLAHAEAKTTSSLIQQGSDSGLYESIAADIEMGLLFASHGELELGKSLIQGHLENFAELRNQFNAMQGSRSFRLVLQMRRLKRYFFLQS